MSAFDKLKDMVATGAFPFDAYAEGARKRMAHFDVLTPFQRELANEYGVSVVSFFVRTGADGEALRACCANHRETQRQKTMKKRYG